MISKLLEGQIFSVGKLNFVCDKKSKRLCIDDCFNCGLLLPLFLKVIFKELTTVFHF